MLTTWSDFFTLTGTAGATLLGLLFVVVTLSSPPLHSASLRDAPGACDASFRCVAFRLHAGVRPCVGGFVGGPPGGASAHTLVRSWNGSNQELGTKTRNSPVLAPCSRLRAPRSMLF